MLKIIGIVVAVYAVLCLALYLFQSRLVFFPTSDLWATPKTAGLDYEDVHLTAGDGTRVHGWYIPAPEAGALTLLFLHGNAGNISHRLESLRIFHLLGVATLIIDYRGYGQSGGNPSEANSYEDALLAWRHLTTERGIAPERIVVFGRSLGAGVATWLAREVRPAGLILESPFRSVPALAAEVYPMFPVRYLARIHYDNTARVAEIACPLLVAHSAGDEIIPIEHGRAVFEAAPQPKRFLEMRGGHNDGFLVTGTDYYEALKAFLASLDAHDRASSAAGRAARLPEGRA